MEFPDLGNHCFNSSCKKLDFLPMKCDACANIFCRDHIQYATHNCPESYKKDNQVPVCPLCNVPVSVKKGDLPDVIVGRHIDNDCQSDTAKQRRKVYTNKCSFKSCKQKELVPVKCDKCHKNFCLRHRHELDHNCQGYENTGQGISNAGAAAVSRSKTSGLFGMFQSKPQQTPLSSVGRDLDRERRERQVQHRTAFSSTQSVQAGMSEDEAFARALQLSMAESQSQQTPTSQPQKNLTEQEKEDMLLAQALAASEEEAVRERRRREQSQRQKSTCHLS
ncbi:AN1-type zinc finger protein 2A-like [Gigantopelta aegis]|uniref:AN1-type zinc finger protein 2A-like n=2 Tax=Gigantopelta aegis TaxID=1735272 RepID=UPI001B88A63A|nr:AN1-type zinc finger protein 2A-like [Gigantopelta aegis]